MTTPELIRTPNRTEGQARSDIAAADRRAWFPGTRALGEYGIMSGRDGREVARFKARYDRDATVAMARAFDDMREALHTLVDYLSDNDQDGLTDHAEPMTKARNALLKAESVKP